MKVARSVALCGATELELEEVAVDEFGLEVMVDEPAGAMKRKVASERSGLARHTIGVAEYLKRWEGVDGVWSKPVQSLLTRSGERILVDGLVVRGWTRAAPPSRWSDLEGLDVTVVVSTSKRLGMYAMGMAVFARALAERAGARADAVIVARANDSTLGPLLREHAGVSVWVPQGVRPD